MAQQIWKFFSFSGRASRREFAWVFLVTIGLGLAIPVALPGGSNVTHLTLPDLAPWAISAFFSWIQIAVLVRRLHDLDKSGWLLLLAPIVGVIILVWAFGRRGTPHDNRFGAATASGALLNGT